MVNKAEQFTSNKCVCGKTKPPNQRCSEQAVEATLARTKSPSICLSERGALTRTTKSKFIKLLHVKFYLSDRTSLVRTYQPPYRSLIATVNLLISDGRHSFGKWLS